MKQLFEESCGQQCNSFRLFDYNSYTEHSDIDDGTIMPSVISQQHLISLDSVKAIFVMEHFLAAPWKNHLGYVTANYEMKHDHMITACIFKMTN